MIGETISHYRITSEIGAGGMGVVYEAEDFNLKRTVALKFLPPDLTRDAAARKRFIQEAQTASAIDHPNVCTIHEVGETDDGRVFIEMARYTGETLRDRIARGPVPVDEALDIAGQIAAGLAKAHSQDIVHRDIKPGNIFVTEDGVVKILDFGLARIAGESRMTKTGTTVGTVAYMSPEQAEGRDVDARADVWALGAVLYEMLAGRAPFRGDAEPAIVNSILTTDPEPVTKIRREVPLGVEDVVDKALTKDREKRYTTARELGAALETQRDLLEAGIKSGGSVAWKRFRRNRRVVYGTTVVAVVALAVIATLVFHARSQTVDFIAVLPVEDLSADAGEKAYFADGMTSHLIDTINQVGSIQVSSRKAAQRYKETELTLPEIADELGVEALMLVTTIRDEGKVRVSAQLIDPYDDRQLWTATIDRDMSGILGLYRDVARSMADQVHAALSPEAEAFLGTVRDIDPAAYDAWAAGNHLFDQDEYERAQVQFERAIAIDSTYAAAWSGLANTYIMRCHDWPVPEGFIEKSRVLAERAIELDPTDAEAYIVLAHITWEHQWDWETAQRMFDRGFELNPSSKYGHLYNIWYCAVTRNYDEAVESALKAVELAPFWFLAHYGLWLSYRWTERFDEAWAAIDRTNAVSPGFNRDGWDVDTYSALRDYDNAIRIQERRVADSEGEIRNRRVRHLASLYARAGKHQKSNEYYSEWMGAIDTTMVFPSAIAVMYADLGRHDDAFRWFDKAYLARDAWLIWRIRGLQRISSPVLKDPRFQELVEKIGIGD